MKRRFTTGLTIVAILIVVIALAVLALYEPAAKPDTTAAPKPRIKVGFLLSSFSAHGRNFGKPLGFWPLDHVIPSLVERDIELFPIIEPGTENINDIPEVLQQWFPRQTVLDGSKPEQLQDLDVIITFMASAMKAEVLDAIERVASDGVGLIIYSDTGGFSPGRTPQIARLTGMEGSTHAFKMGDPPVACVVVGEHALLGRISGKLDQQMMLVPKGVAGKPLPQTKPLILAVNREDVDILKQWSDGMVFSPLYVSQIGKGRIVGIHWHFLFKTPIELQRAVDRPFLAHAVHWLAETRLAERATTAPAVTIQ